jgi:hypothetical protein
MFNQVLDPYCVPQSSDLPGKEWQLHRVIYAIRCLCIKMFTINIKPDMRRSPE